MPLSRRTLLARLLPAAALLSLAGCGDDEQPLVIAATGPAVATAAPLPALRTARQVEPPVLVLSQRSIAQGGTFFAQLKGEQLVNVTAEFMSRQFQTLAEGSTHQAIIPAGQMIGSTEQVPAGAYPIAMHYEIIGQPLPRTLEAGVTITPTQFPVAYLTFTPQVAALLEPSRVEQETAMLRVAYGGSTSVRLWEGAFLRPSSAEVSDVYGSRRSYQGGPPTGSHSGVDFGAGTGVPVTAAANGRVVLAQMMPVRGNMVILDHGAGVFTGYCHLSAIAVVPGQEARAGDLVGATGATGLVTGPHLHWEVVVGGMHVDGLRWLEA